MQVINLCKELGIKYADMKKGITPVAENMDINLKSFRPMSKLTEQAEQDIRFIFKDKDNPDYTFVEPQAEPLGRTEKPVPAPVEAAPSGLIAEKKPATKPWLPSRLLDIPAQYKKPGFTYRWCDADKPGNIKKKQQEGWEIDRELSRKINGPTVEDGKPLDSTSRVRELVVMRIPTERAEARNKYYQERGEENTATKKQELENEIARAGGQSYGVVTESRG